MSRTVFCQKYQKELPGLSVPPYPGPLGSRIYEHISQQAWNEWLAQQTILINENRLNVLEPKTREYLSQEMSTFLFGGQVT